MTGSESACSSRDQVVALHALYGQLEKHSLISGSDDPRAARLKWASELIGRELRSFSELNRDEARELIDKLKGSMGQAISEKPNPWRRVNARDRAHAAGTAGRGDEDARFVQLANADDFARIHVAVARLGWTQERYEAWLCSKSSPLGGKSQVRTVAEVNKLWWALKNMLRRSGRWHDIPVRKSPARPRSS